jgi:Lar family restriction alleviation protein
MKSLLNLSIEEQCALKTDKDPAESGLMKLLSCPFCGGNEIYIAVDQENQFAIICEDCSAKGPSLEYEDQAERAWNERR